MDFGSINNLMMSNSIGGTQKPMIGMGATHLGWTDRQPYTVIYVSPSGKTVKVQQDSYLRIDKNGMSECQTYRFQPNPDGDIHTVRLTKKGWRAKKMAFVVGQRDKYHDFSF